MPASDGTAALGCLWLTWVLVVLGFWVGMALIAWHFIAMFW